MLATSDDALAARLDAWREEQTGVGRRSARMTFRPGSTIGIIGGGQLGRMLAHRRRPARLPLPHLRPARAARARPTSRPHFTRAAFDDVDALRALRRRSRRRHLRVRESAGRAARSCSATSCGPAPARSPSPRTARDEKSFIESTRRAGRAVARGRQPRRRRARPSPSSALPLVLKTRRYGYDGKGQAWVRVAGDAAAAWDAIGEAAGGRRGRRRLRGRILGHPRALGGRRATPSGTRPRTSIATASSAARPCPCGDAVAARSTRRVAAALRIAEALDHVGVLTVEFFASADGPLVNEIAPRVHNSGHWTIEGAVTSQFEQHIRAICGLPPGSTGARRAAARRWTI